MLYFLYKESPKTPVLLVERQTRSLNEVYPERSRRGRDDVNEEKSMKTDFDNNACD
jgi:hypothetical protein